jgi:hypothetical protein
VRKKVLCPISASITDDDSGLLGGVSEWLEEDAVSRAYYAILHGAKAALFVHNVATASHAAVRRMFGQHLIMTGEIERQWSSHFGEGFDDRLAADYDARAFFSAGSIPDASPPHSVLLYDFLPGVERALTSSATR